MSELQRGPFLDFAGAISCRRRIALSGISAAQHSEYGGQMGERKSSSWFKLFKEKQRLQEEIAKLKRSIPALHVQPVLRLGPSSIDLTREDIARKETEMKTIDARLAQLERATEGDTEGEPAANAMTISWSGTKLEFAQMILDAYEKGFIRATGPIDALRQAALHFVDRDGKAFKPRSLYQSVQNKRG
jgi:hypothetical protein